MSLETNRIIRPKSYTYQQPLDLLLNAEAGAFIIIDNRMAESFRATLNAHIRTQPANRKVRYKSLKVSKNKSYFFKVDITKTL